jgi:hypothetical protein
MPEPQLLQLQCPACGGQLGQLVGGVAKCPFCHVQVLLHRGSLRPVTCGTLPERVSREAVLPLLEKKLRSAGFEELPELGVRRRGRARTRAPAEYEIVREGLFGIPWSGVGAVYFVPDASGATPTESDLPDDMSSKILSFEDNIVGALQNELKDRGTSLGKNEVLHTAWTDDLFVLTLPVDTWSLSSPQLPTTLTRRWYSTRPDQTYTITVDRHSGEILQADLPRKGVRVELVVGVFLLGMLTFLTCTTLPGPLITIIVMLAEAVL